MHTQKLLGSHKLVIKRYLRQEPNQLPSCSRASPMPKNSSCSSTGLNQADQDLDAGRFAGTVGASKSVDFTCGDFERQPLQRNALLSPCTIDLA